MLGCRQGNGMGASLPMAWLHVVRLDTRRWFPCRYDADAAAQRAQGAFQPLGVGRMVGEIAGARLYIESAQGRLCGQVRPLIWSASGTRANTFASICGGCANIRVIPADQSRRVGSPSNPSAQKLPP